MHCRCTQSCLSWISLVTKLAAVCIGGHARVGFENNLQLSCRGFAASNESLVAQVTGQIGNESCYIAIIDQAKSMLGMY
jgi:uncharacterized protein (DUF849 family)